MLDNFLKPCLFICLILCFTACSKIKDKPELFGSYVADYNIAKEKLTLSKDGTFVQEVVLKATSKRDTTNGKWGFDRKMGYVSLQNYMAVLNGFRQLNPDYSRKLTSAYLPAETLFDSITIGSDEGVLYKKID